MSYGRIHWVYMPGEKAKDSEVILKGIEEAITLGVKMIVVDPANDKYRQFLFARYLLEKVRDLINKGDIEATYDGVREYCEGVYRQQEEDDRRMRYELAMKAIFERKLEQIRTLVRQKLNRRNPGMKVPEWIINNYKPRK